MPLSTKAISTLSKPPLILARNSIGLQRGKAPKCITIKLKGD